MDITDSLAPASDQLDAIELIAGPRTFVIESVSKGPADQPVQVHLRDFPRPWRPGKSMRRVLAAGWGTDATVWVGRSVRLYCDTEVTFGPDKVGGTRIASMSHLDQPLRVPLLVKRGKSQTYTVEPLAIPTLADINAEADPQQLRDWWQQHPNLRDAINARGAQLKADAQGEKDWQDTTAAKEDDR